MNGKKYCRALLISILIIIFTGCVILPIPHRRVHSCGAKGRILDSVTNEPVAGAVIAGDNEGRGETISSADGNYVLKPVYGWHGAVFIGPTGLSLFPALGPYIKRSKAIHVSRDGYQMQRLVVDRFNSSRNHAYLLADDIHLAPLAFRENTNIEETTASLSTDEANFSREQRLRKDVASRLQQGSYRGSRLRMEYRLRRRLERIRRPYLG